MMDSVILLGGLDQVGPNTYLGRAWVMNPVRDYKPSNPLPGTSGVVDSLEPALNATFMAGLRTSGFEGPNSLSKEEGGWGRYDAVRPSRLFVRSLLVALCSFRLLPKRLGVNVCAGS